MLEISIWASGRDFAGSGHSQAVSPLYGEVPVGQGGLPRYRKEASPGMGFGVGSVALPISVTRGELQADSRPYSQTCCSGVVVEACLPLSPCPNCHLHLQQRLRLQEVCWPGALPPRRSWRPWQGTPLGLGTVGKGHKLGALDL